MQQLECTAILFDLDGVLIDSTECITRHWQDWAQQHGLDIASVMQVAHGRRTIETMRMVAPHLALDEEARQFEAGEVVDTEGIITIDGAHALLDSIPPGAWAIVTSGSRALATARLQSRGLPVPPTMVTADDVVNGKPHPEPYMTAAQLLGRLPTIVSSWKMLPPALLRPGLPACARLALRPRTPMTSWQKQR